MFRWINMFLMIAAFGLNIVQANLHFILEHHEEEHEHEHCEADHQEDAQTICQHELACEWCDFFSSSESFQVEENNTSAQFELFTVCDLRSIFFHSKSHIELPPMRGSPLIA